MLEFPEAQTLARQMKSAIAGKRIKQVAANAAPHGFAFYHGDPAGYNGLLAGKVVEDVRAFGGHVELVAEDAAITLSDGVNPRLHPAGEKLPAKHQLLLVMEDGDAIVCTVQMYGFMQAFFLQSYNNPYYLVARDKPSPLSGAFDAAYFEALLSGTKPTLSAKAFLATEQRIPGLGNGVLQDILFRAGIHPKTKLSRLSSGQAEGLFASVKETLGEMTHKGGRDTEKDLYGRPGGYPCILSKNTLQKPCPVCGGGLVRQAYLGGNVYFCPVCQPEQ